MLALLVGLTLFLGAHSVRIVAEPWRQAMLARWGEKVWKGLYSVVALSGLLLILWGYGQARLTPQVLWASPGGLRHVAALLTVPAFILLVAAHVPANGIRERLGHPMLLGIKFWAAGHLLANNTLADVLLFGSFLVWAVLCFRSARARDRAAGRTVQPTRRGATAATVVIGLAAWAGFAFWAHAAWIGIAPFGPR